MAPFERIVNESSIKFNSVKREGESESRERNGRVRRNVSKWL